MGVAGLRFGEASGLRWRHYDAALEPLGRLLIAVSYNTRKRQEKAVKTEQPRQVPVHPVLKKILATWKLKGWHAMMGRHPQSDDLLIPSRRGKNRSRHHSRNKLHKDLDRLGLRRRRQHDLRRTFITLARIDGARRDVLEVITHAPRGDILDQYTSLPWPLLCEAVSALQLELREAQVIELRAAVNAGATRPEPNPKQNDDGPDDGDLEAGATPIAVEGVSSQVFR
jgi:integrase